MGKCHSQEFPSFLNRKSVVYSHTLFLCPNTRLRVMSSPDWVCASIAIHWAAAPKLSHTHTTRLVPSSLATPLSFGVVVVVGVATRSVSPPDSLLSLFICFLDICLYMWVKSPRQQRILLFGSSTLPTQLRMPLLRHDARLCHSNIPKKGYPSQTRTTHFGYRRLCIYVARISLLDRCAHVGHTMNWRASRRSICLLLLLLCAGESIFCCVADKFVLGFTSGIEFRVVCGRYLFVMYGLMMRPLTYLVCVFVFGVRVWTFGNYSWVSF